MNSLPELIFTTLVMILLLAVPYWLQPEVECFTEQYIQRGRHQQITVCWDGWTLEIDDTGMADMDSVWYNKNIQPKIDSLKVTIRNKICYCFNARQFNAKAIRKTLQQAHTIYCYDSPQKLRRCQMRFNTEASGIETHIEKTSAETAKLTVIQKG